jgi:hypothetical protein
MMIANRTLVSSDFHHAMRPMNRMKPATREARDVEPEPLHQQHEEKRRDKDPHHAPKLVAATKF